MTVSMISICSLDSRLNLAFVHWNMNIYASTSAIRLLFGSSRTLTRFQNTPTRLSHSIPFFTLCVWFFLYYHTGQSSRLRYEKSKSEGLPAIGTKDLGEIRAKGSVHVPKSGASSIRARTTGKNTKEHYRRCARTTRDDWPASSLRDRDR